jgi:hypothetical protein
MPIARDTNQHGDRVFHIVGAPSTFVIGGDRRIHALLVGYHPNYDQIEAAIEGLLGRVGRRSRRCR